MEKIVSLCLIFFYLDDFAIFLDDFAITLYCVSMSAAMAPSEASKPRQRPTSAASYQRAERRLISEACECSERKQAQGRANGRSQS